MSLGRSAGRDEINSFADVRRLVAEWDGGQLLVDAWNAARIALESGARAVVDRGSAGQGDQSPRERTTARSRAAAGYRRAGWLLVCYAPDTDDLNGKFHRLASEATPTSTRLKAVFSRLGGYPDWDAEHLAELRSFRNGMSPSQIKARLTGSELDKRRWQTQDGTCGSNYRRPHLGCCHSGTSLRLLESLEIAHYLAE